MSTFLISYDLGGPETSTNYQKLIEKIKSFGSRAKALESFRFIKSEKATATIRDELKQHLDSNDKLIVLNITGDYWASSGIFPKDVIDWMRNI